MTPQILNYTDKQTLLSTSPDIIVHDYISHALDELFDIANPEKKDTKTDEEVATFATAQTGGNSDEWGAWIYYPWLRLVVHMPPKAELRALRTSRNRNLINVDEQATLYAATIMIAGMSVGSNIVEALVSQGIGGTLILVDMDIIEPSNLNRIRSPYHHVGLHKVEAISRKVWEIDPYISIVPYNNGLNDDNLKEIIDQHAPDILIDEMDELKMKINLRLQAKAHKLPVIMAADDGDDALIDVERYDLHDDLPIFNNLVPADVIDQILNSTFPRAKLGMIIGKYFVGPNNVPLRMFESLQEVGKTLPSWPQLGGAAALSGVSLAYASKKILLGLPLTEGRTLVSLEQKLNANHQAEHEDSTLKQYQSILDNAQL